MENNDDKNSANDDILKCRENILKAGGKISGRPRIPTFEEMVSPTPDPVKISENDDPQPMQTGGVPDELEIPDVLEGVDLSEDLDQPDASGMEVLADQDWRLPGENTEQPENPVLDQEIEDVLGCEIDEEDIDIAAELDVDQIDLSSPLVTSQEQQELLAEPEDICESHDQPMDQDEEQIAKQIEDQLVSMSEKEDESNDQQQQGDAIPEFNVYKEILSVQRKRSSTNRLAPVRKSQKKTDLPKPTGTVANIINRSKGITEIPQTETAPAQIAKIINIKRGVIHGPDNITETQSGIITDIVNRHITDYYGKAV